MVCSEHKFKRHNKLPAKSDADEFNRHFSDIATDSSYNDITIQLL